MYGYIDFGTPRAFVLAEMSPWSVGQGIAAAYFEGALMCDVVTSASLLDREEE